jgi:hypothetical protein
VHATCVRLFSRVRNFHVAGRARIATENDLKPVGELVKGNLGLLVLVLSGTAGKREGEREIEGGSNSRTLGVGSR